MEPVDPNALPIVELARGGDRPDDDAAGTDDADGSGDHDDTPGRRVWWYVVPTAALVVVGLVVGILVFNSSATDPDPGLTTPRLAAQHFVAAVNAGDADAAASVACSSFTDGARAEARTGGAGVQFALTGVLRRSDDTAIAVLQEKLSIDGDSESATQRLNVFRQGGRWLVCGSAD